MSKDTNDLLLFSNFHFSDKMFPAFGFGAQVPPQWQVGGTLIVKVCLLAKQNKPHQSFFHLLTGFS